MIQRENATVNYRETDGAPPPCPEKDNNPCYRDYLKTERDVFIKLFGKIRIETLRGVVTSKDLQNARYDLIKLLVFSNNPVNSREIMYHIKPNGLSQKPDTIRQLVLRTRQATERLLPEGIDLIETSSNGYRLNAYLTFITDVSCFNKCCDNAQNESDPVKKAEYLQQAIDFYRGDILVSDDCSEKLGSALTSKYNSMFQNTIEDFCMIQYSMKNYDLIHGTATDAVYRGHNDPDIHYWIIMALYALNRTESAEKYLEKVCNVLDRQSVDWLKNRISKSFNNNMEHMI